MGMRIKDSKAVGACFQTNFVPIFFYISFSQILVKSENCNTTEKNNVICSEKKNSKKYRKHICSNFKTIEKISVSI